MRPICLVGLLSNPSMGRRIHRHAWDIRDTLRRGRDWPGLRFSLRRCCLLTKQAASVLNSTAAARKQIVATTPATTGRASPSSGNSAGGKGSERANKWLMDSLVTVAAKHLCVYLCTCFLLKKQTRAGHSHNVAALADQVIHDSHHSKLIPGLLCEGKHTYTHSSLRPCPPTLGFKTL